MFFSDKEGGLNLDQKKEITIVQAHLSNLNAKLNDKRSITKSDAEKIASLFGVYPSFIQYGGYKNYRDELAEAIGKANAEGELLFMGLWSFAALTGYKVTPPDPQKRNGVGAIVEAIKTGYQIEHSGKIINLSLEEMNHFENMLCDMAESAFKYLFKERGVDNG